MAKDCAKSIRRYAAKLKRIPKGLTKEDHIKIQEFYNEAARLTREKGESHHVDHIFPMQGENISGLHVPWNLQVLTGTENTKKGNKLLQKDVESHRDFIINKNRPSNLRRTAFKFILPWVDGLIKGD